MKHIANINKVLYTATGKHKREPDDFKKIEKYLIGIGIEFGCAENRVSNTVLACDYQSATHADMVMDCSKKLPFRSNTFDFIVSCHALKDMADPLTALIEWQRILKPEGKMILVLPDMTRHFKIEKKDEWQGWAKWFCSQQSVKYMLDQVQNWIILENKLLHEDSISFVILAQKMFNEVDSYQWAYTPIGLRLVIGSEEDKAIVMMDDYTTKLIDKNDIKIIGYNRSFDMYNLVAGKPMRYGGTTGKTVEDFHKEEKKKNG